MKENKKRLENYVVKKAKKKNGSELYDERQLQQTSNMFMTAAAFAIVFDVVMMAVHIIKHNVEKGYPYMAQLLVICVAFGIASLGRKEPGLPRTLSGISVDPEKNGKGFAKRLLDCVLETAVTVAAITALKIYVDGKPSDNMVSDTAIFFTVFLLIEIAVCEIRVHRWRVYQHQLDEEENDIDDPID